MEYKLLVVDIDGTLLNKDGNISDEDKVALAEASRSGTRVSLSTGRGNQACFDVIEQLSLDGYHIFFDGALVSNPENGDELYGRPLGKEAVKKTVEFTKKYGMNLELYSATHYFAERETWSTEAHRKFFGVEPTIVDFNSLWQRERIIKGLLVTTTPEESAIVRNLCLRLDGSIHCSWASTPAFPGVDFINLLAPAVSKGIALEALVTHLGISMNEVIAIGDGTNDISLLSIAGLAVAMNNAPDEVKAVAHHVTHDVGNSGVAAAIRKFLL